MLGVFRSPFPRHGRLMVKAVKNKLSEIFAKGMRQGGKNEDEWRLTFVSLINMEIDGRKVNIC